MPTDRWLRQRSDPAASAPHVRHARDQVMVESLVGDPVWEGFVSQHKGEVFEVPNILEVSGWVQGVCAPQCNWRGHAGNTLRPRDGVPGLGIQPGAGWTWIRADIQRRQVDNGTVLMTALREGDDPANQLTATRDVSNDGSFFVFMQGLEAGMVASPAIAHACGRGTPSSRPGSVRGASR